MVVVVLPCTSVYGGGGGGGGRCVNVSYCVSKLEGGWKREINLGTSYLSGSISLSVRCPQDNNRHSFHA